jgi:hypothetical protein
MKTTLLGVVFLWLVCRIISTTGYWQANGLWSIGLRDVKSICWHNESVLQSYVLLE